MKNGLAVFALVLVWSIVATWETTQIAQLRPVAAGILAGANAIIYGLIICRFVDDKRRYQLVWWYAAGNVAGTIAGTMIGSYGL